MAPSELARLSYTCLKGGNSPEPLEWVLEAYWMLCVPVVGHSDNDALSDFLSMV